MATRRKNVDRGEEVEQAKVEDAAAAEVVEEVKPSSREKPAVSQRAIDIAKRSDPFRRLGVGTDGSREDVRLVTQALVNEGYLTNPSDSLGWDEQTRLQAWLSDHGKTLAQLGEVNGFVVVE